MKANFDACLAHLQSGMGTWFSCNLERLDKTSPLYAAGARKDDHVFGEVIEVAPQSGDTLKVELRYLGRRFEVDVSHDCIGDNWLVLDYSMNSPKPNHELAYLSVNEEPRHISSWLEHIQNLHCFKLTGQITVSMLRKIMAERFYSTRDITGYLASMSWIEFQKENDEVDVTEDTVIIGISSGEEDVIFLHVDVFELRENS